MKILRMRKTVYTRHFFHLRLIIRGKGLRTRLVAQADVWPLRFPKHSTWSMFNYTMIHKGEVVQLQLNTPGTTWPQSTKQFVHLFSSSLFAVKDLPTTFLEWLIAWSSGYSVYIHLHARKTSKQGTFPKCTGLWSSSSQETSHLFDNHTIWWESLRGPGSNPPPPK